MTSLSEQLTAVRQSQWETQLDMFHTLGSRAIDSAEQLIALNMKTSRASIEQATGTFRQLLEAGSPRDLMGLGSAAQDQWQHLMRYSSELLGIASGTRARMASEPSPLTLIPAPALPAGVPQAFEQMAIATRAATSINSEIAVAAADTGAALTEAAVHTGAQEIAKAREAGEAALTAAPAPETTEVTELDAEKAGATPSETPTPAPTPAPTEAPAEKSAKDDSTYAASATPLGTADSAAEPAGAATIPQAKTTQVADAVQQLAATPAAIEHPAAATLPVATSAPVDIPHIAPVVNTPPPPMAAAPEPKPPRASRKK